MADVEQEEDRSKETNWWFYGLFIVNVIALIISVAALFAAMWNGVSTSGQMTPWTTIQKSLA